MAEEEKPTETRSAAKRIRSAAAVVGSLTMGSRVLGFIRDVLFARLFFGAGLDAWALAFTVPNLFRRLFGEGALSSAFLPIFVGKLESGDKEGAGRFAGKVIAALAAVLGAVVAVGIVGCLVGSFAASGRAATILRLAAAMLPYAVLICVAAVYAAVLNSLRHFATPAAAPMALNVVLILAMLLFARGAGGGGSGGGVGGSLWVLVAAVLVGGAVQLGMQVYAARAKGMKIPLAIDRGDEDIRLVVRRMMPAAMGLGVFQLNVLFDRLIAVAMVPQPGAVSALYLGNRIIQLPLALFAIAAATAAMPELSSCAARRDYEGLRKLTADSIRSVLFWALPAAAGLALLGEPIARFLFEHLGGGAFRDSADSAARVGMVIAFYAGGLGAFAITPILTRAFFATGDTKTPARVAVICVGANLALNLILVRFFDAPPPAGAGQSIAVSDTRFGTYGEAGLALASSISFLLQAGMLAVLLWRRRGEPHGEWAHAAFEPIAAVAAAVVFGWLLHARFISFVYGGLLRPYFQWVQPNVIPWTRAVISPAAAGAVFLALIFWLIHRRTREESVGELFASALRLGVSAALTGALVHLVLWSLPPFRRSGWWQPFDRAFFPVVAGFLFYWLLASIFRVTEYEEFRGWTDDDGDAK